MNEFTEPVHFSGCHTLSKVSLFIPFPAEVENSSNLQCFDPTQSKVITSANCDPNMAEYLAVLLSDASDDLAEIELKQIEEEIGQSEELLSPLIQSVLRINNYALQTNNFQNSFPSESIPVRRDHSPAPVLKNNDQPSTSSNGITQNNCSTVPPPVSPLPLNNEERPEASNKRKRPLPCSFNSVEKSKLQKENNVIEKSSNRPVTPTEVLKQREAEWNERQRQRLEKYKQRQDFESWDNDERAQNESLSRFSKSLALVLDRFENVDLLESTEIPPELLIDARLLQDLKSEANRLKSWRKLNDLSAEKLQRLLIILERNIKDVLDDDGALNFKLPCDDSSVADDNASAEAENYFLNERLLRSLNAASLAMLILTSPKMPKQLLMDGVIERSYQICKQSLDSVLYPCISPKTQSRIKKGVSFLNFISADKRRSTDPTGRFIISTYQITVELVRSFSELSRFQTLNESIMVNLSSIASPPFFYESVPEIQIESIKLLSIVFSKCPFLRKNILFDLINSLHRLPTSRTPKNCYRLNNLEMVGNFTVLIMQLIQSIVIIPKKKHPHSEFSESIHTEQDEQAILESHDEAKRMASFFLGSFLTKCTAKSEEDYRRLFELFLQDLLTLLYRPEWPVAELLLTMLANNLVKNIIEKTNDISLRVASLDYLGTITARLRRDRVTASTEASSNLEQNRLDLVVKSILNDESTNASNNTDDIDISHLSSTEKVRKLEQALIDYVIGTKCVGVGVGCNAETGSLVSDSDVSVEYILNFYIVEWYRETVLDVEVMKERYKEATKKHLSQKDIDKYDKKLERIKEKGNNMKEFILGLIDRRYLKKRMQAIAKTANVLVESDANWVVRYLASKKELTQSFELYLDKILKCFSMEYPVHVRAKAMKCLAQLVEADHKVLMMPDVNKIVQERMIDANASVREATFDTIGKFLISRPDLLSVYYPILINRIRDSAIAVRKRVIRILRDIIKDNPAYEHRAEILAEIVQRINDEETVKKLCLEIFQQLWFQPVREHATSELDEKIQSIVDTVMNCVKYSTLETFENLINLIFKNNATDRSIKFASKQIVDALVDTALTLDSKTATNKNTDCKNMDPEKNIDDPNQIRLLACLTALSLFAKIQPGFLVQHIEIFIPYLSLSLSSNVEQKVLNQMILMLERVVPLIEHPSESLIRQLDTRLNDIVRDGGMVLIASAISCMSAVYNKFKKIKPGICSLFQLYLKYLDKLRHEMEDNSLLDLDVDKKPIVMRSLYSIGIMCRYFNFDELITDNDPSISISPRKKSTSTPTEDGDSQIDELGPYHSLVFSVLFFFTRNREFGICQKAIISLGQLSASSSSILRKDVVKNMYMLLLGNEKTDFLPLRIQVLKNLSCFLHVEEEKAMQKSEKIKKDREEQNTEQMDLKEMELSSSGLSSSIIQQYWTAILNCYFHNDDTVRSHAAQVIWQTLEQGLVTPGSSIPTLVSMSTDRIQNVRERIEVLIKDMNTKYKGMIISKAIPGVRMSYQLQKLIQTGPKELVRGIRIAENPLEKRTSGGDECLPKLSNDAQALLANFYTSVRGNRQQRRSFLSALLRLFSEDVKEKIDVEEWIYVADNLAHFPYQMIDEPLFVIHQADSIVSLSGQNILSGFKQLLLPSNHSRPSADVTVNVDEEIDEFSVQYFYDHIPEDKTQIYELKRNSQACFVLLHLKTYLMRAFGFKKEKVTEYSPSEATNVYEKGITRKNIFVFSPDSLLDELKKRGNQMPSHEEKLKLAEEFHRFYEMLLCVQDDQKEEPDAIIITP